MRQRESRREPFVILTKSNPKPRIERTSTPRDRHRVFAHACPSERASPVPTAPGLFLSVNCWYGNPTDMEIVTGGRQHFFTGGRGCRDRRHTPRAERSRAEKSRGPSPHDLAGFTPRTPSTRSGRSPHRCRRQARSQSGYSFGGVARHRARRSRSRQPSRYVGMRCERWRSRQRRQ